MNSVKEGAAPGIHRNDGPPRLNSRRCGNDYTPATALNQSLIGAPPATTRKQQEGKMNQELVEKRQDEFAAIEQVVMQGDLSRLNSEQRVMYYRKVCESSGLNPYSNPFAYILLNGKLTLYAKKDCTEQLRKIHGVSIELDDKLIDDIYVVTAKARDKTGRIDQAKGAVVVGHLKGEQKANAIMKAETKAKRRVTLSICGMGWTDESEIDSIPNAYRADVDLNTGEIKNIESEKQQPVAIEIKPRLSATQIAELENILNECDDKYKTWVYDYVRKTFRTDDLTGVPAEMYERMRAAAVKNMEQNYEKLSTDTQAEVVVEVAQ